MKKLFITVTIASCALMSACGKKDENKAAEKVTQEAVAVQAQNAETLVDSTQTAVDTVVEAAPQEYTFPTATKKILPDPLTGMIYAKYNDIYTQLVKDDYAAAQKAATTFKNSLVNVPEKLSLSITKADLIKSAAAVSEAKDIEELRLLFKVLSENLVSILVENKYSGELAAYILYCPMYKNFKKTYWIQSTESSLNPYLTNDMRTCGSLEKQL